MKYKISNAYAVINGEEIQVGVALGQEDLPESPFTTGYVTNSEYEQGLKEFRYGKPGLAILFIMWLPGLKTLYLPVL